MEATLPVYTDISIGIALCGWYPLRMMSAALNWSMSLTVGFRVSTWSCRKGVKQGGCGKGKAVFGGTYRKWLWGLLELFLERVDVVQVHVGIAKCVDEVAGLEIADMGD